MPANSSPTLTTLKDCPHFREQTLDLIEKSFKYSPEFSFSVDFFPLLAESNAQNNHILILDETVIAHLGCLPRTLTENHPIILMGGIAVDENYRGQGFFATLMKHVTTHYKDSSALYLLWSDKNELYEKFNFHLSIGQISPTNNPPTDKILSQFEQKNLWDLTDSEFQEIKDIYQSMSMHYTCVERKANDWNNIKKITSTKLYLKRDEENFIQAYFFMNKGFDLQTVIHEVGYFPSEKKNLLKKLSPYNLWLPEIEKPFYKDPAITYMASMAIANHSLFTEFITDWSTGELEITNITDTEIIFIFSGKKFTATYPEFFQFIWGPYPAKEFEDVGLPLYIAGVDSI